MQHFFSFNKAFQHIADLYRTYAGRGAREDVISFLKGEIFGKVYNQRSKRENQVSGMSILYNFPVLLELKMDVLWIF